MPLVLGIRYPLTALRAKRRSRLALLDESALDLRVRARDCDMYGHINNGRYLSLMDLGRIDMGVRNGFAAAARANGWKPVAAGATIRFRRELRWRARYRLTTRVAGWDSDWFFIDQRFTRADGALAAQAYAKIALLDGSGKRVPTALVVEALGFDAADAPPLPSDVTTWQQIAAG